MSLTGDAPARGTPAGESDGSQPAPSALAHQRLRAPRGDREVLAIPPLPSVGALLATVDRSARCDYDMQGRSLCDLSSLARRELLASAQHYTSTYRDLPAIEAGDRVLLAGHQPQLFHPGVWFKNFALAALARSNQATAVNLVIDTDTLKDTTLRVPGGSVDEPVARLIPFDDTTGEVPFARRSVRNRRVFESFGRTAADWLRPLIDQPLLDTFWPKVVARSRETSNLGECLSQARHQLEGEWGNATLELPQSRVCRFESFHWFVAHVLAHLPRFVAVYNEAVVAYRRLHGIRSANHPAPELAREGDWLEAPFWLASDKRSDRRHLFARRRGSEMVLSDRYGLEAVVPLAAERDADGAVEALAKLAEQGVQLQTRALTTTLFARLCLGDLFIHGIGGGKYDQLTDELVRRFFLLEPPPFMVLSATLYLPVQGWHSAPSDARRVPQELRDLRFHPERYLDPGSLSAEESLQVEERIAVKRGWIATPRTRENARRRCRAIRSANEALQPLLEEKRRRLTALNDETARRSRAESVLRWREYAFCLYPEDTLRGFLATAFSP
ncbi:MAG TPA: hypothetical protein VNH11_33120 [Pirellulales bacterium]|nr:hypothetical protein [Pirellulales bacterium]